MLLINTHADVNRDRDTVEFLIQNSVKNHSLRDNEKQGSVSSMFLSENNCYRWKDNHDEEGLYRGRASVSSHK